MKTTIGVLAICLAASAALGIDFDGDGVADEFRVTRDAKTAAKEPGVLVVNPWQKEGHASTPTAKGFALVVHLSRKPQTYLLFDHDFFNAPMWSEAKPEAVVISKTDRRYPAWKKQVPALQADAIQLGTEASIDILLYWTGKQWRLFWPDQEP